MPCERCLDDTGRKLEWLGWWQDKVTGSGTRSQRASRVSNTGSALRHSTRLKNPGEPPRPSGLKLGPRTSNKLEKLANMLPCQADGRSETPLPIRRSAPRDENGTRTGTLSQSVTQAEQGWQMLGHSREHHHDTTRSKWMKCRSASRAREKPINFAQQYW